MSGTNKPKHKKPEAGPHDVVMPGDHALLTWPDKTTETVRALEFHDATNPHKATRMKVERNADQLYDETDDCDKTPVVPITWLTPITY